ncbi:MAG: hypothetical protein RLP15_04635 [Cryomorphaceae bacterium]
MRGIAIHIVLALIGYSGFAQQILLDSRADYGVAAFSDELLNIHSGQGSMMAQPMSRRTVANLMFNANVSMLNGRQKAELKFYQLAFSKDLEPDQRPELERPFRGLFQGLDRYKQPDLAYYHQGQTTVTINPILGASYWSNQNGVNWQRRVGGDIQAYIGRFGLYGSVRDVYERSPMSQDSLLNPQEGALYKFNNDGSREFSETRGGITYDFDVGYVGLVRDHVRWGYGYYSTNILDINTVPFAQIKLHLNPVDWFQFDYFHGSLQSDVVDSNSIVTVGAVTTFEYHNKFIAANLFSFRPIRSLWLTFGNSIVYSERAPELTYFIPVMFYKSVDHYLNGRNNYAGGNAQMFAAASLRPGKGVHLYSTLFVDELSFRRMFDPTRHTNWYSIKSGLRWSNFLPNATFTIEHYRSNPMVYKHFLGTTNFENAGYTMGHYLRDNAREYILSLRFKPYYWLSIEGRYQYAQKGIDNPDVRGLRDPITGIPLTQGIPFLESTTWLQTTYTLQIVAQPVYRLSVMASLNKIQRPVENERYQVPFLRGSGFTWQFGVQYGL